jgi:hypothetical protein
VVTFSKRQLEAVAVAFCYHRTALFLLLSTVLEASAHAEQALTPAQSSSGVRRLLLNEEIVLTGRRPH